MKKNVIEAQVERIVEANGLTKMKYVFRVGVITKR